MVKALLFSFIFITSITTSFAEDTSKLTYLDKEISIRSAATNKKITIIAGSKTIKKQNIPVFFQSQKFAKWEELQLPKEFSMTDSFGEVIVKRNQFYLAIKKRFSEKRLFLTSKDGINWNKGVTVKKYGKSWIVVDVYNIDKEKIYVLWDGFRYMLYNTHHKLPIQVWQHPSSSTSLTEQNTIFSSYCFTKGRIFVSSGAGINYGPTPIAYSNNLLHWGYPKTLRPDTKEGNKIYSLSCLSNGNVLATGNSGGVFYDQPNIQGMLVHLSPNNKGHRVWNKSYLTYPISNSIIINNKLFIVGWDKATKNSFYTSNNSQLHTSLPKSLGSRPETVANNDRIIIVGKNLIYEKIWK